MKLVRILIFSSWALLMAGLAVGADAPDEMGQIVSRVRANETLSTSEYLRLFEFLTALKDPATSPEVREKLLNTLIDSSGLGEKIEASSYLHTGNFTGASTRDRFSESVHTLKNGYSAVAIPARLAWSMHDGTVERTLIKECVTYACKDLKEAWRQVDQENRALAFGEPVLMADFNYASVAELMIQMEILHLLDLMPPSADLPLQKISAFKQQCQEEAAVAYIRSARQIAGCRLSPLSSVLYLELVSTIATALVEHPLARAQLEALEASERVRALPDLGKSEVEELGTLLKSNLASADYGARTPWGRNVMTLVAGGAAAGQERLRVLHIANEVLAAVAKKLEQDTTIHPALRVSAQIASQTTSWVQSAVSCAATACELPAGAAADLIDTAANRQLTLARTRTFLNSSYSSLGAKAGAARDATQRALGRAATYILDTCSAIAGKKKPAQDK